MKTLGWPPNFVARCPVKLFEAAGGSNTWVPSGTAGEFHMRPLGNAVLHFQLRDLLDNQILFEHTMRKPEAFIVSTHRFFVIRLENGTFRGFGFTEKDAASEMKKQVQKAVKPYSIRDCTGETLWKDSAVPDSKGSMPDRGVRPTGSTSKKETSVVSYESVPKRSTKKPIQSSREQEPAPTASRSSMFQSKWKIVLKGLTGLSRIKRLTAISQVLGRREREMEIGYPTDVKHVAHIGWDGPSVGGPNWIDELKPAPDFSSGPLREFGQPKGPEWIHDAFSAAKWTAAGLGEPRSLPPNPPTEYLDSGTSQVNKKESKWKVFRSGQKSSNEAADNSRDAKH